jgi:hypothetical protein
MRMLIEVSGRKNGGSSDKEASRSASTRLVALSNSVFRTEHSSFLGFPNGLSTLETTLQPFSSTSVVLGAENILLDISLYGKTRI